MGHARTSIFRFHRPESILCLIIFFLAGVLPRSVRAQAEEPYKIAVFTSSKGSEPGEKARTIEYFCREYLKEFNKKGLHGRPVEPLFLDDFSNGEKTQEIVAEALREERLLAMLGVYSSSNGRGIVQEVGESGVPLISEMSVDSLFRDYGNIFTMTRSATQASEVFLRFLEKNFPTTVFIGLADDVFNLEFHDALGKAPDRVTLLGEHLIRDYSEETLSRIVEDVRAKDPQIVSIAAYSGGGAKILEALRGAGINKPVYAASGIIPDMLQRMDGGAYEGDLHQIGLSISHSNSERLVKFERGLDLPEKDKPMLIANLPSALPYRDMLALVLEVAGDSPESLSIDLLHDHIVEALGKIQFGKDFYPGVARNWAFTRNRSAAMEELVLWKPKDGADLRLFPEQLQETAEGTATVVPVVYANIDMVRISEVDSTKRTFDAEFYISLESRQDIALDRFEFTNAYHGGAGAKPLIDFREIVGSKIDGGVTGENFRLYKVWGRFTFSPRLSRYPFDTQLYSISFQPRKMADPFFVQPPPLENRDNAFEFENWTLQEGDRLCYFGFEEEVVSTTHHYGDDLLRQRFYRYNFTWTAKRSATDYYLRVVIPLVLIMIVAYFSVFIPSANFSSIIAIQVTSLLSTIALYLAIPKLDTETATSSDHILIFAEAMIGLMIALSILRENMAAKDFRKCALAVMLAQILAFPVLSLLMYLYIARLV